MRWYLDGILIGGSEDEGFGPSSSQPIVVTDEKAGPGHHRHHFPGHRIGHEAPSATHGHYPGHRHAVKRYEREQGEVQEDTTDPHAKGNEYLKSQRRRFKEELDRDPHLRKELAAVAESEYEEYPTHIVESLMNRMAMTGHTLKSGIHGGFYGPVNRGELPRHIAALERDPNRMARMNAAIDRALAGSNYTRGFTDQGGPGDPNYGKGPTLYVGSAREGFNDFGPGGRRFREEQQRHVHGSEGESDSTVPQTPPSIATPISMPHGTIYSPQGRDAPKGPEHHGGGGRFYDPNLAQFKDVPDSADWASRVLGNTFTSPSGRAGKVELPGTDYTGDPNIGKYHQKEFPGGEPLYKFSPEEQEQGTYEGWSQKEGDIPKPSGFPDISGEPLSKGKYPSQEPGFMHKQHPQTPPGHATPISMPFGGEPRGPPPSKDRPPSPDERHPGGGRFYDPNIEKYKRPSDKDRWTDRALRDFNYGRTGKVELPQSKDYQGDTDINKDIGGVPLDRYWKPNIERGAYEGWSQKEGENYQPPVPIDKSAPDADDIDVDYLKRNVPKRPNRHDRKRHRRRRR